MHCGLGRPFCLSRAAGIGAYLPGWREPKAGRGQCCRRRDGEPWSLEGGAAPRPGSAAWPLNEGGSLSRAPGSGREAPRFEQHAQGLRRTPFPPHADPGGASIPFLRHPGFFPRATPVPVPCGHPTVWSMREARPAAATSAVREVAPHCGLGTREGTLSSGWSEVTGRQANDTTKSKNKRETKWGAGLGRRVPGGPRRSLTARPSRAEPGSGRQPALRPHVHKQAEKTTRVRTVLNEKQLHTLRTCYAANPRPDALMKEQLVEMTGLSPRVIRVWFQNKRCKDKKKSILMKQLQQQQHNDKTVRGRGRSGGGRGGAGWSRFRTPCAGQALGKRGSGTLRGARACAFRAGLSVGPRAP